MFVLPARGRYQVWLRLKVCRALLKMSWGPCGSAYSRVPCFKVSLSISCSNLQDKDVFSKSDPMVVVYLRRSRGLCRGEQVTLILMTDIITYNCKMKMMTMIVIINSWNIYLRALLEKMCHFSIHHLTLEGRSILLKQANRNMNLYCEN